MNPSLNIGLLFALSGFAVLLAQLMIWESARYCRAAAAEMDSCFGHDTKIFPDHII